MARTSATEPRTEPHTSSRSQPVQHGFPARQSARPAFPTRGQRRGSWRTVRDHETDPVRPQSSHTVLLHAPKCGDPPSLWPRAESGPTPDQERAVLSSCFSPRRHSTPRRLARCRSPPAGTRRTVRVPRLRRAKICRPCKRRAAGGDVVPDGPAEQPRLLQHHRIPLEGEPGRRQGHAPRVRRQRPETLAGTLPGNRRNEGPVATGFVTAL
jgi:hypothetical protein